MKKWILVAGISLAVVSCSDTPAKASLYSSAINDQQQDISMTGPPFLQEPEDISDVFESQLVYKTYRPLTREKSWGKGEIVLGEDR